MSLAWLLLTLAASPLDVEGCTVEGFARAMRGPGVFAWASLCDLDRDVACKRRPSDDENG